MLQLLRGSANAIIAMFKRWSGLIASEFATFYARTAGDQKLAAASVYALISK
jgi:hypothetical protein